MTESTKFLLIECANKLFSIKFIQEYLTKYTIGIHNETCYQCIPIEELSKYKVHWNDGYCSNCGKQFEDWRMHSKLFDIYFNYFGPKINRYIYFKNKPLEIIYNSIMTDIVHFKGRKISYVESLVREFLPEYPIELVGIE